jgi:multimeric flavodoxin WrbA
MDYNSNKGIIILGSARSDGNTRLFVDKLSQKTGFPVVDLNARKIAYFDYDRPGDDDDFLPTILELLAYDTLIFATPVYWYTMSAVMKTFFDRFSDLLMWHKDVGRRLRGKSMGVLSCSPDDDNDVTFTAPFKKTAEYLGLEYLGDVHCWLEKGAVPAASDLRMQQFVHLLLETTQENVARHEFSGSDIKAE